MGYNKLKMEGITKETLEKEYKREKLIFDTKEELINYIRYLYIICRGDAIFVSNEPTHTYDVIYGGEGYLYYFANGVNSEPEVVTDFTSVDLLGIRFHLFEQPKSGKSEFDLEFLKDFLINLGVEDGETGKFMCYFIPVKTKPKPALRSMHESMHESSV